MANDEYVAVLKEQLEAGTLTARTILEGADDLKRCAENHESVQGKSPRELLLLATAVRTMVLAHLGTQINLPQPTAHPFGRLPATHYGWGADDDDPQREESMEEEARRQEQKHRT